MLARDVVRSGFIPDPDDECTENHVEIVGYLGREPQVRYTADGLMTVSLSIATHHWHEEDGAAVQTTEWHRTIAYGDAALACAGFRPGELVRVRGRLRTHTWRDRFGSRHERTEVVAADLTRARRRPAQLGLGSQPHPRFAPGPA